MKIDALPALNIPPPDPADVAKWKRAMLRPHYVRPDFLNSRTKNKLGFDLHGVIDANRSVFRKLFRDLIRAGWQIHIITGGQWSMERETLKKMRMPFTHFFSIVNYHDSIGTPIIWDKKGCANLDVFLWLITKAQYCKKFDISMHSDDSDLYGLFFKTPYLRYCSNDSERKRKIQIDVV